MSDDPADMDGPGGWPEDLMLESAWGIIANVDGGNWLTQTPEWQQAAERWRDAYGQACRTGRPEAPTTESRRILERLASATELYLFGRSGEPVPDADRETVRVALANALLDAWLYLRPDATLRLDEYRKAAAVVMLLNNERSPGFGR